MALSLQKFREIVFQFLYSRGFEESEIGELSLVMRQNAVPKKAAREALEKAEEIWKVREELDQLIDGKSDSYDLERVPMVERTILRLGVYELRYTDLPPKVAIAESLRLTRKFATPEGITFVNALLDALYKETEENASISEEPVSS